MARLPTSGIRLFKLFGIQVYLHWSWLLIALIQLQNPVTKYGTRGWNIAEYLALFGIVLMHEFGHALACRSVGGQADRILLWPLGGVAFVSPPPRPGAVLWSIAAGPLVNVILLPVTIGLARASGVDLLHDNQMSDPQQLVFSLFWINLILLLFNMLPIYPLDGGQILRSLLWFMIGPARSLKIASVIGLVGAAGGLLFAISQQSFWLMIMAGFAALQSWAAFQRSRSMNPQAAQPPRIRADARCPSCGYNPPVGPYWMCACGKPFDVFEYYGRCPNCGGFFHAIPCPACRAAAPPTMWRAPIATAPPMASSRPEPTL